MDGVENMRKKMYHFFKALREAKVLVSMGTSDMDVYAYFFETLKANGDYRQLETIMKIGAKRNPHVSQVHKYLLFAYLKNGKEDQAMAEMEQILKLLLHNCIM